MVQNNIYNADTESVQVTEAPVRSLQPLPSKKIKGKPQEPPSTTPTRVRHTGSALTSTEAMEICQKHHDHHFHCSRRQLAKILRQEIPDTSRRPSNQHIKEFRCYICEMARSKAPPASSTHPPSTGNTQYQPGEFLYIDGSGAYNLDTLDHSTQHVVVHDHASHAKFALPTRDKKAVTVLG